LKQGIGETKRTIASFQSAVDASNCGFVKRMDQLSASFDELWAQEAKAEGHQAKAVEKAWMECDALKAIASEQGAAIDGRIDEQNAAVSTAVAILTKRTEAAIEELHAFIAASSEPARTELESACTAVAQELRGDLETALSSTAKTQRKSSRPLPTSIAGWTNACASISGASMNCWRRSRRGSPEIQQAPIGV
jgi:predicted phage tail protein